MHKYNRVLKVLEVATIRLATVIMCLSKAKRLPQLEGKSLYYNNLGYNTTTKGYYNISISIKDYLSFSHLITVYIQY